MKELLNKDVIVRTVTAIYTGTLKSVDRKWIKLEDCSWIPDTGRWAESLAHGTVEEVEPYPDGPVYIMLGVILDVSNWGHPLPRIVK